MKLSPENAESRLDLAEPANSITDGALDGVLRPEIPDKEMLDDRAPSRSGIS